jgi:recombinational DNA repair ATPase RecF
MSSGQSNQSRPTIRFLKVTNYRALRNVELRNLTPLTVLLGPNGSGKSTVFRVRSAPGLGQARSGQRAQISRRRGADLHRDQIPGAWLSAHHIPSGC